MNKTILPYNIDAERSVLGAVMLNRRALMDVLEIVKSEDFYDPVNGEVYDAIWELYKESRPVDILTVSEELQKRGVLKTVGGSAYVAQLTTDVPSTVNAAEYAKIVSEKSNLRKLITAAEEIANLGYNSAMGYGDLLDHAERKIFKIAQRNQKNDYADLQSVLSENLREIDALSKSQGKLQGIPTGFKELDERINGLKKAAMYVIGARPGMGKTAFALNLAMQASLLNGSTVLIFDMEMRKQELGFRFLASEARVDMQRLQKGKLEKEDWERIYFGIDNMQKSKIYLDDTPGISLLEMRNKCRRLKSEHGLDLIIVDYIQLMEDKENNGSRQNEVASISRSLKLLAREMDCPVVALSQLSRGTEGRSNNPQKKVDHRPKLADLRDSGAIEQDADVVMFLYRDEEYNKDSSKPGICEVIIEKNRSGPKGTVELTWVARYTKFSEMSRIDV